MEGRNLEGRRVEMETGQDINKAAAGLQYGQYDRDTLKTNGVMFSLLHDLHDRIDTLQKLTDMLEKSYEGVMIPIEQTPQKPSTPPDNRAGSSPLARQLNDAILRLEIQNAKLDSFLNRSEV